MNKYKIILLILSCCIARTTLAHQTSNVQAFQQGKQIIITYDLDEPSLVDISVTYTETTTNTTHTKPLYQSFKGGVQERSISGEVGLVTAGKGKQIEWDVLLDYEKFIYNNVQFTVTARSPYSGTKTVLLAEYGYGTAPQHSYGLRFGQVYKKAGWYISARSDFSFAKSTNGKSCVEGGFINNALPFYNGESRSSHFVFDAGLLVDMSLNRWNSSMIALYTGIGYGSRQHFWQTTDGEWIIYSPTSFKGLSAEAGLIGVIHGFTLSAGVSTIAFKYLEFQVGIGYTIPHKIKL